MSTTQPAEPSKRDASPGQPAIAQPPQPPPCGAGVVAAQPTQPAGPDTATSATTDASPEASTATPTADASATAVTAAPETESAQSAAAQREAQAASPEQDGAGGSPRDGGQSGGCPAQLPVQGRLKRRFNSRADIAGALETLVQWTVMGKMEASQARTLASVLKDLANFLPKDVTTGGSQLVPEALRERLRADDTLLNEMTAFLTPAQLEEMMGAHDVPRK